MVYSRRQGDQGDSSSQQAPSLQRSSLQAINSVIMILLMLLEESNVIMVNISCTRYSDPHLEEFCHASKPLPKRMVLPLFHGSEALTSLTWPPHVHHVMANTCGHSVLQSLKAFSSSYTYEYRSTQNLYLICFSSTQ